MRTLFEGEAPVHYGQIYVESRVGEGAPGLREAFADQRNGLCGASTPGFLFLITGLHTGHVGFTVEAYEDKPAVDKSWQEIVEVSFRPSSAQVGLLPWGEGALCLLDLDRIDYRVRYCCFDMDSAHAADTLLADEPCVDRYLLQFWPHTPRPDRVVKRTSAAADYWHRSVRELPPPPSPEEQAAVARRVVIEAQRVGEDLRLRAEARAWGGRLPSDRLRNIGGNVFGLVSLDRDLVDAIAECSAQRQREIARWAARRAVTASQLAQVDWIASALDALDEGRELPPPFTDEREVWELLLNDPCVPRTTVTSLHGDTAQVLQQALAVPALLGAVEDDPLRAALDSVYAAAVTFGRDHRVVLDEVNRLLARS